MRNSRRTEFRAPPETPPASAGHWSDVASDPNAGIVKVHRARVLRAAWRQPISDRIAFIEAKCRDRRVLDIGCVAHDVNRMSSPKWLHGRIAAVAQRCVGVDLLASEIEEMRKRGYEVVLHDLTTGFEPIASLGPFDVIVAGELIEHVEDLGMLFRLARSVLSDGGELIITTPNPYAPGRVRAGQLGIVWENVDHIVYAFPSGIAELCERHGLALAEAAVTGDGFKPWARPGHGKFGVVRLYRIIRRRLGSKKWLLAGYATTGVADHVRVEHLPPQETFRRWFRRGRPFLGETFIYVVTTRQG
ncbi:MAG TPA: methyltransferase domain-containing protein [Acidimicrobiia bacterium]|nr:methyltransferase domain-containing protein [Acidimicrobiia bacterium]